MQQDLLGFVGEGLALRRHGVQLALHAGQLTFRFQDVLQAARALCQQFTQAVAQVAQRFQAGFHIHHLQGLVLPFHTPLFDLRTAHGTQQLLGAGAADAQLQGGADRTVGRLAEGRVQYFAVLPAQGDVRLPVRLDGLFRKFEHPELAFGQIALCGGIGGSLNSPAFGHCRVHGRGGRRGHTHRRRRGCLLVDGITTGGKDKGKSEDGGARVHSDLRVESFVGMLHAQPREFL